MSDEERREGWGVYGVWRDARTLEDVEEHERLVDHWAERNPATVNQSDAADLDDDAAAGVADPDRHAGQHAGARRSATALHNYLVAQKEAGRTVLGYGAPSKAPVLLDVSKVGPDLLPFTVDAAPAKHGRRIPGCGVPIRPVDDLRAAQPDVVLVLTWDIADEVIAALEAGGGWGAQYLTPSSSRRTIGVST